ncbi:hypothetical protein ACNUDN_00080 [Mycobacterium sp. smrl_JER01]|uniref:hypothetical protein n=1 Tax=Mycobacterium sp. smrl_JER01 TaxID=3402633 RepID=UPI003AC0B993
MSGELREGVDGRWLGRRGIFRHYQVLTEIAVYDSKKARNKDKVFFHTMSTAVSGEFNGHVVGELIRWVSNGEVGYEARINGVDDSGGICDIAAHAVEDLAAIAKVANDLRYEWESITVFKDWTA